MTTKSLSDIPTVMLKKFAVHRKADGFMLAKTIADNIPDARDYFLSERYGNRVQYWLVLIKHKMWKSYEKYFTIQEIQISPQDYESIRRNR